MRYVLKTLALPPFDCLLLAAAGWLVGRRWRRLGRVMIAGALVLLWALSTPLVGTALLRSLQADRAVDPAAIGRAQAIVVLSADLAREAPEFGGLSVGHFTLQRIRYGAYLHGRSGLPLLVSGGLPLGRSPSHASVMKQVLEEEFKVPVRWTEERSRDTWENAQLSAEILRRDGIGRVLVVTHAWHMPRALRSFAAAGLAAEPAPTAFRAPEDHPVRMLLPSIDGLQASYLAMYEWLGRIVYAFK